MRIAARLVHVGVPGKVCVPSGFGYSGVMVINGTAGAPPSGYSGSNVVTITDVPGNRGVLSNVYVQDAAQRAEEVSRKVAEAAQGTTENVRRLMALPNAAEGGLRDLRQGVTGLFEGVVRTNLRAAQELFRLANPAPFVELQQRFAREYTDTLLRNGATLARAVRRTADETLRPLEQQIQQQQREQANQGGQGFQTAAE